MIKKLLIVVSAFLLTTVTVFANSLSFIEKTNITTTVNNVTHQKITGTTYTDAGTKGEQNINIFTQGEGVEVVSWQKSVNGKYVLSPTLEIAKDFEKNNPEFEVIAGVNGDYFSGNQTINSNVIYGNRTINPQNHSKYQAVEFNLDGSFVKLHKRMSNSNEIKLSLYGEYNNLKNVLKISNPNQLVLSNNETSLIDTPSHIYDKSITYYEISNLTELTSGSHFIKEGTITKVTTDIKGKLVLATKNNKLIDSIKINDKIIIQKEVIKDNYSSMVTGVGSHIIRDGDTPSFEEIGDQNLDFAKGRHPRTGFGYNIEGEMMLITADGRMAGQRDGLNLREFSKVMDNYGIVNGYNLDGGGSTQAIVRNGDNLEYANIHSDSVYRNVANALFFVKRKTNNLSIDYKKVTDGIEMLIDLASNSDLESIEVIKDGKSEVIKNTNQIVTIKLDNNKYTTISVIGKIKNSSVGQKNVLLFSDHIKVGEPKEEGPELVRPEFKISHTYKKKSLNVNIEITGSNESIDKVRVNLKDLDINKPALVKNASSYSARFDLETKLKNQVIEIEITYKDKTTQIIEYELKINDKKIFLLFIPVGIVVAFSVSGFIIKRKC